jgi:inward rectifier potassium channel
MAAYRKRKFEDLGLGVKATSGWFRSLNKDGSFNVKKTGLPFFQRIHFYHVLVSMSWFRFLLLILSAYLVVNIFFASLYFWIGVENLTGIDGSTEVDKFIEAFFFSSQTITTLGYGRTAPISTLASTVAAIESMIGLLAFALATGLLYGRFSKPSAKIKYSHSAVVAPYQDIKGFMFRVLNPYSNQLLEVEVTVTLSMKKKDSDLRDFHQLELERNKVVFLPSIWTIVHPINEASPLYNLSEKEVLEKDAEFIVMMRAFDESFSQTVYSRSSYKAEEIKWGHKFVYVIEHEKNGISLDVSRIDETEFVG